MLERVLETWLDRANERSFQVPFCHSLAFEGYKVIHMSRHCGMELGKDILAIAPDGIPCAYQLKGVNGGRLSLGKWRSEVQKQMYDLVMGRIVHPSITIGKPHRSYLVINGELDEEVSRAIDDFNVARKEEGNGHLRIRTILKGELLSGFKKLQTDFWPTELTETKTFLEMFLETGRASLPRGKLASLFESLLPFSKANGARLRPRSDAPAQLLVAPFCVRRQFLHFQMPKIMSLNSRHGPFSFRMDWLWPRDGRLPPAYLAAWKQMWQWKQSIPHWVGSAMN